MPYTGKFKVFEDIIQEMMIVYQHDRRPWLIGYSGGKDSTLLVALAYEAITRLPPEARTKKVYIITSDTLVENPIVKNYMHGSSNQIGASAKAHTDPDGITRDLKIESHIIYPDPDQTFWSRVIGLGYPTPEPPGFRWCTERLKINPMNRFVDERIKESGEIIILLGVRKAESTTRNRTITAREIEGKLLNMHSDIKNAYVYNPITEINNDLVWEFLLKDDGRSPWGSDLKYLFSLYQGENLGEEQSVIGEIDKDKIPVTGNSRFGCWCCTIVREDKSLQNFIDKGATELIPLRRFRNWLVSIRQNPAYRDTKRRDGSVYFKNDGTLGLGPFTMWGRQQILEELLKLQRDTGMELITLEELKVIDQMWDNEGDLSKRALVDTYFNVYGKRLPWDPYKEPLFDEEGIAEIRAVAEEYDLPEELMTKLIVTVEKNKHITRNSRLQKEFDKVIQQGWIHFDAIRDGMNNEDSYLRRGGISKKEYGAMQAQISREETRRDATRKWLREAANDSIPFVILRKQLFALRSQMIKEEQQQNAAAFQDALNSPDTHNQLMAIFAEYGVDDPIFLSEKVITSLTGAVGNHEGESILNLSKREHLDLLAKIGHLLAFDTKKVSSASKSIAESLKTTKSIRKKAILFLSWAAVHMRLISMQAMWLLMKSLCRLK